MAAVVGQGRAGACVASGGQVSLCLPALGVWWVGVGVSMGGQASHLPPCPGLVLVPGVGMGG